MKLSVFIFLNFCISKKRQKKKKQEYNNNFKFLNIGNFLYNMLLKIKLKKEFL